MTEREKFLMRMALIYMISNMEDVNEAFSDDAKGWDGTKVEENEISVNGDIGEKATEDELSELMPDFD